MKNLIPLVINENMKIYRRAGAWLMLGLLMVTVLGTALFTKYAYVLEPRSLGQYMLSNSDLISVVTLFSIVIASGVVSTEYTRGTIKLLLIRPANRSKILLSKYVATLLYALLLLVTLVVCSFLSGGVFLGFENLFALQTVDIQGQTLQVHIGHIVAFYVLNSVELIMMVSLAFMISTVFRSQALAVGLVLFLMFTGEQVVYFLSQYEGMKYVLFANLDLMQFVLERPLIEGMTLSFSILVLLVHFAVFYFISWLIFMKRDITV